VSLTIAMDDAAPRVAADGEKVKQVLVNLIDNAVKYSTESGAIEVSLRTVDDRVRFSVRDDGLGIPLVEQQRIFDKFHRLDPDMTRGVGGTGLGLYICKQLVDQMNGRIWVASRRAKGRPSRSSCPPHGPSVPIRGTRYPSPRVRRGGQRADQLRASPPTPQEAPSVSHPTAFRLLVILTALLAAAFNGGWKWDAIPH
jgi:Signal transduction histidine kinase